MSQGINVKFDKKKRQTNLYNLTPFHDCTDKVIWLLQIIIQENEGLTGWFPRKHRPVVIVMTADAHCELKSRDLGSIVTKYSLLIW